MLLFIRIKLRFFILQQTNNQIMRKNLLFVFMAMLALTGYAQRTCNTMEVLQEMMKQDPNLMENMEAIEAQTRFFVENNKEVTGVITIPVVVHVVYRTSIENISDAQILSQIAVLNEDFRRLNADRFNTPSDFTSVAADVQIEFCLASVDPQGNTTTGITRTATNATSFGTNNAVKFASQGGVNAWPSDSYLNIWVCTIGNNILGYAQFPGGSAATDGVVIDYRYFGTNGTATAPFNLGRTATHEVGHWLNLRHIWGDGGCSVDDFVNDTPLAGGPNYTGSPCIYPGPNSCSPKGRNKGNDLPDMFQNYMDYSDDGCMNLFTLGQTARMRALFDASGARATLLNSNGCGTGGGGGGNPPAPTCFDGIQNGNETGVDCGGPDCQPCQNTNACNPPTGLTASSRKGGREANLSWNTVSGALSYDVNVYSGVQLYASGTVTSTSATVGGLSKGSSYTFTVSANCSGSSSTVSTASFTARLAQENAFFEEATLFPNPSNGVVQVSFTSPVDVSNASLMVTSITGSILQIEQFAVVAGQNDYEIDISSYSTGVYIVVIDMQGERVNLRLLKD